MGKHHYQIFVFSRNPAREDCKADHKLMADNKRQLIGLLKTAVDNFDPEHISIFRLKKEAIELKRKENDNGK